MAILTRNETAAWLCEHDNFCILTHRRPDGDTAGSAAVLCRGLRKLGKNAAILENPELTAQYTPLHLGLTCPAAEEGSTIISVDVAAPNMLPHAFEELLPRIALRIDHHGSATSFTPDELVDPHAAACGEIIYDLLEILGVKLDPHMAEALYIAVSTDTGCFRYSNTNAHTYRVAAACADTGAALYPITEALFDTNSLSKLKLQSWMVEHAVFLADGKAAVCAMPRDVEMTVSYDDMESIPGFLRSIEGVRISATVRETKDGGSKMSVRAVPGYDAAAVCAKFGGGGHKGAAGATTDLPLSEAGKAVEAALLAAVEGK